MHLYPRRWNVAAQVAEELKTVTCATPPVGERRKKKKRRYASVHCLCSLEEHVQGGVFLTVVNVGGFACDAWGGSSPGERIEVDY